MPPAPLLPDGRPVTPPPLCLSLDTALILNKLDKQLSTQCGPTLIFKQVLGHPYCDNNYAALLVECRLYIYVIMQQSSIKRDNMSLKKVVGH